MTMEILEIALREYDEAKEFYETEQTGLGSHFEKKSGIPSSAFNNTLKHGRLNAGNSAIHRPQVPL